MTERERTPPREKTPPSSPAGGKSDAQADTSTPPIDWFTLSNEERPEVLAVLHEFLMMIVPSYQLPEQVVPPCWFKHEALIHEILALFQLRQQATYSPAGGARTPYEFHTSFHLWIARMRAWVSETGCTSTEHRDGRTPMWVVTGSMQNATYLAEIDDAGITVTDDERHE